MKIHLRNAKTRPLSDDEFGYYLMRVADLLSDDPFLIAALGKNFKVLADYDAQSKRITYSFRQKNDTTPDDYGASFV